MRSLAQQAEDELEEIIFTAVVFGWHVGKQATGTVLASLMVQWETLDRGNSLREMKTVLLTML